MSDTKQSITQQSMTQQYLDTLGIQSPELSLACLNRLQSRHISQFSFNSLSVVLGQELPLDIPSLFEKIVVKGRGGYCFEHNKLIYSQLEALGFDVRLVLARVTYNRDVDTPRTHRITLVTLDNQQFVVDGGFGHLGARQPVSLDLGVEQRQGDECFRVTRDAQGLYQYQVYKDGDFFTLYTFDLNHYTEADCLVGHFYSHRHPDAAFVNNLVVCRKHGNSIHSLRNSEFHCVEDGVTSITQLIDAQALHEKLTQTFELDIDIAVSEFLFSKFGT